ncbi:hypothetical protein RQP54_17810 [Curvibacter sp. APW13]|uniref:hypothetical protein n=1 Tax=Curvibacter sp. APW13 TaxID=3077236 RepID=UPI0028DDBBC6|nr:hypothetical protein [Curvibacter sp. APW13]MDT8992733.1 hypothetical protein [Curvibacter sp. APW13]
MADLKKSDEAEVKRVLEVQAAWRERKLELEKYVQEFSTKAKDPTMKERLEAFAADQYFGYLRGEWMSLVFGEFAKVLGPILDLATPSPTGLDPYDRARNKEELEYVHQLMKKAFSKDPSTLDHVPNPKSKTPDRLDLDEQEDQPQADPMTAEDWRNPANAAVVDRVKAAMRGITQAYGAERLSGTLDTVLAASTQLDRLTKQQLRALHTAAERLDRLRPANGCSVDNGGRREVCMLSSMPQGQACLCPRLTLEGYDQRVWIKGVSVHKPLSAVCETALQRCELPSPGPLGTPCMCVPNIDLMGPWPVGRVVPARPMRHP